MVPVIRNAEKMNYVDIERTIADFGTFVLAHAIITYLKQSNIDIIESKNFAASIIFAGKRARDGQIALEEMAGGTFTISNGGVFGSLMGTPIINPPQSAILGTSFAP